MRKSRRSSKRQNKNKNHGTRVKRSRRSKKRNNDAVKILITGSLLTLLYLYSKSLKNSEILNVSKKKPTSKEICEQIANNHGYTIKDVVIKGDGSCMFRSVSYQLENNQENYQVYRNRAVDYIRRNILTNPELNENFINMIREEYKNDKNLTHEKYLEEMSTTSRWGDSIILQALSNDLNRQIIVINCEKYNRENVNPQVQHFRPGYWNQEPIENLQGNEQEPIVIGFINRNHYICMQPL